MQQAYRDVGWIMVGLLMAGTACGAQWEGLPDNGRAFKPLLADPREAINRVAYMKDGDPYAEFGLGGDLGLVGATFADESRLTVSARALMVSRFEFGAGAFDLLNTDYVGGCAVGLARGHSSLELSLYHQSSHLGDEMLYPDVQRPMLRYHYDALRLLADHRLWQHLRLYGGGTVRLRSVPEYLDGHWGFQVGAEWTGAWGDRLEYYAALDAQWRELRQWERDFTLQVGVFLGPEKGGKHHKRLFLEVHDGMSTMGQFYLEPEDYVVLGFALNW